MDTQGMMKLIGLINIFLDVGHFRKRYLENGSAAQGKPSCKYLVPGGIEEVSRLGISGR